MSYQYDEIQGEPRPAHHGSQQMAGDVHDISQAMKNIQESVKISRDLNGLPDKGGVVIPHPANPMGGY